LRSNSITEPHSFKNNYIKIKNIPALIPESKNGSLEAIKFNKNVAMAFSANHKMSIDMSTQHMNSISRTLTNRCKIDKLPSFFAPQPLRISEIEAGELFIEQI
jgi:hypothetical protein